MTMITETRPETGERRGKLYLSDKQIRQRYGNRSATWLWRLRKNDSNFPAPIRIAGTNLTAETALDQYDDAVTARGTGGE